MKKSEKLMPVNNVHRAHYDELEFDDQLALLDSRPFTGIIYADYDNGRPEMEYNYIEGLPSGIQRRWYASGQLEDEWEAIRGHGSAWSRKWHPNGMMKYERINKDDRLPLRIREWSEDGTLLRDTGSHGDERK